MEKRGRKGLRRRPPEGWPLDHLLVGVATLRTTRELYLQHQQLESSTPRAWDLALWNGVTPGGSANSLKRLHRLGYVELLPPDRPGRAVRYRVEPSHPLARPLRRLFDAERAMCRVELRWDVPRR